MYFDELKQIEILSPELVGKDVVVYGTEAAARRVYREYIETGCFKSVKYCDSSPLKQGKYFRGSKIISPDELLTFPRDTIVIIAVNDFLAFDDIAYFLHDNGFKNTYTSHDGLWVTQTYDLETNNKLLLDNKEKINRVFNLLHDDASRKILQNIIMFRKTNNRQYLRKAFSYCKTWPQYFPPSYIFSPEDDEIFIDAGCFDTGSIYGFSEWTKGIYKKVYSFEPTDILFDECKQLIEKNHYKAEIINAGLYSYTGKVPFNSNANGNAWISEVGDDLVNIVSLDELMNDRKEKVTYIKMDIEGSEMEALKGCFKTIDRDHPKLAISIYHKLTDLWEIPIWIIDNFPNYKFYLGHHAPTGCETILYARWDDEDFMEII